MFFHSLMWRLLLLPYIVGSDLWQIVRNADCVHAYSIKDYLWVVLFINDVSSTTTLRQPSRHIVHQVYF